MMCYHFSHILTSIVTKLFCSLIMTCHTTCSGLCVSTSIGWISMYLNIYWLNIYVSQHLLAKYPCVSTSIGCMSMYLNIGCLCSWYASRMHTFSDVRGQLLDLDAPLLSFNATLYYIRCQPPILMPGGIASQCFPSAHSCAKTDVLLLKKNVYLVACRGLWIPGVNYLKFIN